MLFQDILISIYFVMPFDHLLVFLFASDSVFVRLFSLYAKVELKLVHSKFLQELNMFEMHVDGSCIQDGE